MGGDIKKPVFGYRGANEFYYALMHPSKVYENVPELFKDDFWPFIDIGIENSLIGRVKFSFLILPEQRAVLSAEFDTRINAADFYEKNKGLIEKLCVASEDKAGPTELFLDCEISKLPARKDFMEKDLAIIVEDSFAKINEIVDRMYGYVGCNNREKSKYIVDLSLILS